MLFFFVAGEHGARALNYLEPLPNLSQRLSGGADCRLALQRRAGFGRVRCVRLLGTGGSNFLSMASNVIAFPARISFRAVSMILQNAGFVLNAADSRSTFLRETSAATGRFLSVKTTVSCSEASANFNPHFSPPDGRSTREARHYFVALARRTQRTDTYASVRQAARASY